MTKKKKANIYEKRFQEILDNKLKVSYMDTLHSLIELKNDIISENYNLIGRIDTYIKIFKDFTRK